MDVYCKKCREAMKKKLGAFVHVVFQQPITVTDVPYYDCGACGRQFYESRVQVEERLARAYKRKWREIPYSEDENAQPMG